MTEHNQQNCGSRRGGGLLLWLLACGSHEIYEILGSTLHGLTIWPWACHGHIWVIQCISENHINFARRYIYTVIGVFLGKVIWSPSDAPHEPQYCWEFWKQQCLCLLLSRDDGVSRGGDGVEGLVLSSYRLVDYAATRSQYTNMVLPLLYTQIVRHQ